MMLLGSLIFEDVYNISYIFFIIALIYAIGFVIYEIYVKIRLIYIVLSFICMLLSFTVGSITYYEYLSSREYFSKIAINDKVKFQGTLCTKEKKTNSYYLYFNNISIDDYNLNNNDTIVLVSDSDDIPLGAVASVDAKKLQFNKARNEGNFDEEEYLNSIGVLCKVDGHVTEYEKKYFSIREEMYLLREKMNAVIQAELPGEESAIMSAMSLGDKSELAQEIKDLFKLSGLAHILAISGLHVSIVGMSIYKLLKKRGLSFLLSGIISIIIVILYGILCGTTVSCIRAIGMFIIMIIAKITGQGYDMMTGIAAMMIYVLVVSPYFRTSGGFIFSFAAVLGIAVVVTPLTDVYDKYIRLRFVNRNKGKSFKISVLERLIKALLSALLIQLVTLPIVCYFYYEIPVYVVFLNIIVVPLLGVLLSCTLLGALMGVLASFSTVVISNILYILCKALLTIAHYIIYAYEFLAYESLNFPNARLISGQPSVIKIIIYYAVIIGVSRYIIKKSKNQEDFDKQDYIKLRTKVAVVSVVFLIASASITHNDNRLDIELDVMDVGQGDGIYLGGGDINLYFDGGSTSVKNVGTYRILPFLKYKGVKKIDYWFVSHTDEDHISGLMEALDSSYNIDNIVIDRFMLDEYNYKLLYEKAYSNNTDIIVMNKGDIITCDNLKLSCIFAGDISINDINANSLVIYGEYDGINRVTFLIGGDMTKATEDIIINDNTIDIGNVDILKVAHHGSKTSSDSHFIDVVRPDISLISAGLNNSYGHPHDITINTLESVESDIYRTDISGRLLIDLNSKKVLTYI